MHRSETSKQRNRLMKKKSPLNFCIFLSLNFRATDYLLLILFLWFSTFRIEWFCWTKAKNMNGLQQSRTIITNAALWNRLSEWNGLNEFGFMMQKDAITILYFHGLWWIACFFPSRIVYVWNSCALVLLLFWIEIYELSWYLEFIGIHTI